jgi:hypothetical protein
MQTKEKILELTAGKNQVVILKISNSVKWGRYDGDRSLTVNFFVFVNNIQKFEGSQNECSAWVQGFKEHSYNQ